jgi:hypothetical protein
MKQLVVLFVYLFGALFITSGQSFGQDFFIYPTKGQTSEQQERDKFDCYQWSKQQTGFDPMAMPTATQPPPAQEAPRGGAFRGAARGALLGAVVGEIADDDAGKGAAVGAAAGGLFGGMRRRDQNNQQQQAQNQWEQQQVSSYSQQRSSYNRAYSACLEAKGYTVK